MPRISLHQGWEAELGVTAPHIPPDIHTPQRRLQLPFDRPGVNLLASVNGFWVSGPIPHLSLSFIGEEASCLQLGPLTSRKGTQGAQTFPASLPLRLSSVACLPQHTYTNPCGPTRRRPGREASSHLTEGWRDRGTEDKESLSPGQLCLSLGQMPPKF